ncbi:calcium-activated chloride channel-domain-containing protein [Dipodascopsis uninucleata]
MSAAESKEKASEVAATNSLPPSSLECDFVILFNADSSKIPLDKRSPEDAEDALKSLLAELTNNGFTFQVRYNKYKSVFIFIKASDTVLSIACYQSQIREWLHGVRTSPPVIPTDKTSVVNSFTIAERLRLIYERLVRPQSDHGLGITPGQGDWVFVQDIFALHDPRFDLAWVKRWSTKWLLDDSELELIRNTFGEKVSLYFAFLQYYFTWLLVPTIIGLISYICLPDFSPAFAIANCVWCCLFAESWKRHEKVLAVKWGVKGCSILNTPRAAFKGEKQIEDPVTGSLVQYYPPWKRLTKQLASVPTALVAGICLMALQVVVFVIEIFLSEIYNGPLKQYLVFLPTALLSTLVPTFTAFYNIVSTYMTNWENHAVQDTYENSMTQKMFVLNFLTSYMGLFLSAYIYLPFGHYIAPNLDFISTFIQKIAGDKITTSKSFTINTLRLRQQYVYFTATAQFINFFVETLLPYIQRKAFSEAKRLQTRVTGAIDSHMDNENEALFLTRVRVESEFPNYDVEEDYREMVVQFGYLSLFSTVWPLAPLFSFINNWIELRGDAMKICLDMKRPIPQHAESIGPWMNNLVFLTWLGSITTASLVSMYKTAGSDAASASFVKVRPWHLLSTVLISEHAFLAIRYIVGLVCDAIDNQIIHNDKKQKYLNRRSTLQLRLTNETLEDIEHDSMLAKEEHRGEWEKDISESIVILRQAMEKSKTPAEKKNE